MSAYLFVHFTGEQSDGEQIYFSVSRDGLHWRDLNGGQPVLSSSIGRKGVRDPFLVRNPKTGVISLMATDLCIGNGESWEHSQSDGSRNLILWQSTDLIHWSEPVAKTVGVERSGCVWAPEAVWDREREQFLVFWASMIQLEGETEPKQRIYAAWSEDFQTFSAPFVYIERSYHVIDTTIFYDSGWYYRISKDETSKRLTLERGQSLTGEFYAIPSQLLSGLSGVEGAECYRLPDGSWCLIADRYAEGEGYQPFRFDSVERGELTPLEDYCFGETLKRHGGILSITDGEYQTLLERWESA